MLASMESIYRPGYSTGPAPCFEKERKEKISRKEILKRIEKEFPDFITFFKKNNLEDFLNFYLHEIQLRDDGQVYLLVENEMLPWTEAKRKIFGDGRDPTDLTLPHGWKYNYHGFIKKDLIRWTKLETTWKDRANLPGHYFLEVVSKQRDCIGFTNHCILRLIDNNTNVTSVGFCGTSMLRWRPFRGQKGKLASPDPMEHLRGRFTCTRIEITNEEYQRIKDKIETDQKEKNIYFNFITRNCSSYCCEVLKTIGIDIENDEYASQAIIRRIITWLKIKVPKCALMALHYVSHFFRLLLGPVYNLAIFILGASSVDKEMAEILKERREKGLAEPKQPFQSFCAIFDGSNFKFKTGWKISSWQRSVAAYRARQVKLIEETMKSAGHGGELTREQIQMFDKLLFEARLARPPKYEATPFGFERVT